MGAELRVRTAPNEHVRGVVLDAKLVGWKLARKQRLAVLAIEMECGSAKVRRSMQVAVSAKKRGGLDTAVCVDAR